MSPGRCKSGITTSSVLGSHRHRHECEIECHHCEISVLLLVGLPGSGKSTIAKSIVKRYKYVYERKNADADADADADTECLYDDVIHIEYDAVAMDISKELKVSEDRKDKDDDKDKGDDNPRCDDEETNISTSTAAASTAEAIMDMNGFSSQDLVAWRKSREEALNLLRTQLFTNYTWLKDKMEMVEKSCSEHASSSSSSREYNNGGENTYRNSNNFRRKVLIVMDDNFHLRSMRRDVYKVCQDFICEHQHHTDTDGNNKNLVNEETETFSSPSLTSKEMMNALNMDIGLSILHIDTPLDQCIVRNGYRKETPQYIPERIIHNMDQIMEAPDANKAKFESCAFAISDVYRNEITSTSSEDPNRNDHDDVHLCIHHQSSHENSSKSHNDSNNNQIPSPSIQSAFFNRLEDVMQTAARDHPVRPPILQLQKSAEQLEQERQATLQSRLHQVDLMLRAFVGVTCRTDRRVAKVANMARKSILAECKTMVASGIGLGSESQSGLGSKEADGNNNGDLDDNLEWNWKDDSFIVERFQEIVLSTNNIDEDSSNKIRLVLKESLESLNH